MAFKQRQKGERRLAELAAVQLASRPPVCLHVAGGRARLGACIAADAASVWVFTGMWPTVDGEIAAVLEHLAAVFARVVSAPDRCDGRLSRRLSTLQNLGTGTEQYRRGIIWFQGTFTDG